MPRFFSCALCRLARAAFIFSGLAACGTGYAFASPALDADTPSARHASTLPGKPMWTELHPAQQQALAPLSNEWDALDARQKKEWLAISSRYASLKPDQKVRLQDRMRDWVKLTPEERRVARESYSHSKKLNPNQKAAEWQQYQQLSEEQKKKLLEDARAKKRITNLPPASQTKEELTPPSKQTHNPGFMQPAESRPATEAAQPDSHQPSLE